MSCFTCLLTCSSASLSNIMNEIVPSGVCIVQTSQLRLIEYHFCSVSPSRVLLSYTSLSIRRLFLK